MKNLPETWEQFVQAMKAAGVTPTTVFNLISIHPWSVEGETVIKVDLLITIGRELVKTPDLFPDLIVDPLANEFSLEGLDLDSRRVLPFEGDKFPDLARGIGWEKADGQWRKKQRGHV